MRTRWGSRTDRGTDRGTDGGTALWGQTEAGGAIGGAGVTLSAEAAIGAVGVEAFAMGEAEIALQALIDICGGWGGVVGGGGR